MKLPQEMLGWICPICRSSDLVIHLDYAMIDFPITLKDGKLVVNYDTGMRI